MLPNHHITKPVLIGEIKGDGQFDVVWQTDGLVPGDAWSKELEGSQDLVADWVTLKCGNYNTKTKKCGGARIVRLTLAPPRAGACRPPALRSEARLP